MDEQNFRANMKTRTCSLWLDNTCRQCHVLLDVGFIQIHVGRKGSAIVKIKEKIELLVFKPRPALMKVDRGNQGTSGLIGLDLDDKEPKK